MIRNILYRAVLTLKRLMPASRFAMHMIYLNQFFFRFVVSEKHSCISNGGEMLHSFSTYRIAKHHKFSL